MQATLHGSTALNRAEAAALVDRANGGDTGAFEALYTANLGRIYALCLRMTSNVGEAEELTQEAFIRAWQKLHTFRGQANFSTWMHRVAANVVLSRRRKLARERERTIHEEDLSYHASSGDRTNRGPTVDLNEAIAQLPERAREVFVLYDIEGYQHQEIADLMGIAPGTCKAQLHRARKLLREALGHDAQ
jgi:RNA polymerase sigma-70 factor (ECF subfamily)